MKMMIKMVMSFCQQAQVSASPARVRARRNRSLEINE